VIDNLISAHVDLVKDSEIGGDNVQRGHEADSVLNLQSSSSIVAQVGQSSQVYLHN